MAVTRHLTRRHLGQHAVLTLPKDRADAMSSHPYLETSLPRYSILDTPYSILSRRMPYFLEATQRMAASSPSAFILAKYWLRVASSMVTMVSAKPLESCLISSR